jgi:lipid-binding SYLF domain-containing protein
MKSLLLPLAFLALAPLTLVRADNMHERIRTAIHILEQRQGSVDPIPQDILSHARGVAIGTITKAGIGIGGQGGEGIVLLHYLGQTPATWSAPVAYNTSGGSIGAQLGFTTIRYIMVLNTDHAVRLFTSPGKVDWDASATGTAGADTDRDGVSSEALSRRSLIIYKETGGLYGGATLGGSTVEVKDAVNQEAYGEHIFVRDILEGRVTPPPGLERLAQILDGGR